MSQGKCNLLKPVDNLTGTFFLFSQYTQDLTKQFSNPDSWRCVPSKYIALNLDYSVVPNPKNSDESITADDANLELAKTLGEIFENYYENACTVMRNTLGTNWLPKDSLTLLFQTLEKYRFLKIDRPDNTMQSKIDSSVGDISGISEAVQYIGDINIYSNNNNEDGVGYNEIYCYIPNEAKCMDYQMCAVSYTYPAIEYTDHQISGYEGQTPYNNLSWDVEPTGKLAYVDIDPNSGKRLYKLGEYIGLRDTGNNTAEITFCPANIPLCLIEDDNNPQSNDRPRTDDNTPTGKILDKFNVNCIVLLYDIMSGNQQIQKNVPLGIYFPGRLDSELGDITNTITKYVDAGQIYNQGTSYGLRVCTRFFNHPNSIAIAEINASGSSNISEMAPVLEKMAETLACAEDVIDNKNALYQMLKDHLAQFKNNKVNVPYVRQLGNEKYWFVNGKNTGAIAEFRAGSEEELIRRIIEEIFGKTYTKDEIDGKLLEYVTHSELAEAINLAKTEIRAEFDGKLADLEQRLLVYLQSE